MKTNPYINAGLAATYIVGIVSVIQWFAHLGQQSGGQDTIIIPITMLSLFTLSAAVMGYLFVYQPAVLMLDGKRKEAVAFFTKTVASFAVFVLISVAILISTL